MKRFAPAKINLSLRVLGRREDGFHEIETLMVPLSLADEIEIHASYSGGGIAFACNDPTLPAGPGNLAYRAAELFCARTNRSPDVRLGLTKRIPHGAGLGGGSSDAAAVLLALNAHFHAKFSVEKLAALAAELGSDVPFFVYDSAAVCRGRGERVTPVPFSARLPLLLLKPSFPVPTPWAYRQWRDSREIPGVRYSAQVFEWGELVNDLERPVFEKYLFLADLKSWLLEQSEAAGALLSGSGSTVLTLLRAAEDADPLAARARTRFGELWTCACHAGAVRPETGAATLPP
jgi:4-diphosphocytidyl-2-C-methyl-D-erythritol kinase